MHVNDWDAIDPIRALVGREVDPARLRDENVDLAEVADSGSSVDRAGHHQAGLVGEHHDLHPA